jgi:hypothetical protein
MNNRILSFGKTLKSYLRKHEEKRPNLPLCCPDEACKKRTLYKHGRYFRWVTTKYECIPIPIYRWYCPLCGKTVSLFPDFLIPWARVVTTVREAAFNRRKKGISFVKISKNIISPSIGGISTDTIKRWWCRYLAQIDRTSIWVAGELIHLGDGEDLLRLHSKGVNPTPLQTLDWFHTLLQKYVLHFQFNPPLMGYLSFLNTHLPAELRI